MKLIYLNGVSSVFEMKRDGERRRCEVDTLFSLSEHRSRKEEEVFRQTGWRRPRRYRERDGGDRILV